MAREWADRHTDELVDGWWVGGCVGGWVGVQISQWMDG